MPPLGSPQSLSGSPQGQPGSPQGQSASPKGQSASPQGQSASSQVPPSPNPKRSTSPQGQKPRPAWATAKFGELTVSGEGWEACRKAFLAACPPDQLTQQGIDPNNIFNELRVDFGRNTERYRAWVRDYCLELHRQRKAGNLQIPSMLSNLLTDKVLNLSEDDFLKFLHSDDFKNAVQPDLLLHAKGFNDADYLLALGIMGTYLKQPVRIYEGDNPNYAIDLTKEPWPQAQPSKEPLCFRLKDGNLTVLQKGAVGASLELPDGALSGYIASREKIDPFDFSKKEQQDFVKGALGSQGIVGFSQTNPVKTDKTQYPTGAWFVTIDRPGAPGERASRSIYAVSSQSNGITTLTEVNGGKSKEKVYAQMAKYFYLTTLAVEQAQNPGKGADDIQLVFYLDGSYDSEKVDALFKAGFGTVYCEGKEYKRPPDFGQKDPRLSSFHQHSQDSDLGEDPDEAASDHSSFDATPEGGGRPAWSRQADRDSPDNPEGDIELLELNKKVDDLSDEDEDEEEEADDLDRGIQLRNMGRGRSSN